MGRLEAIWIKRCHRGSMDSRREAQASSDEGLAGNADQGGWRQVTLIEQEAFEEVQAELGICFDPSVRRANLMVSGTRLAGSRGRILKIGALEIRIGGETRPCRRMEEAVPGLQAALDPDWRAGAYGVVLNDALIQVGDEVVWSDSEPD